MDAYEETNQQNPDKPLITFKPVNSQETKNNHEIDVSAKLKEMSFKTDFEVECLNIGFNKHG